MKAGLPVVICVMLMAGCISMGNEALNGSGTNATALQQNAGGPAANASPSGQAAQSGLPQAEWQRFVMHGFSFEYPGSMVLGSPAGAFFLPNEAGGAAIARLSVSYKNVTKAYGPNREALLIANPGQAAADILLEDQGDDKLLPGAYDISEISTFSISRGVYGAQVQFSLEDESLLSPYNCYAIDIYMPESSLFVRARISALDEAMAKDIRDHFLESFRPE